MNKELFFQIKMLDKLYNGEVINHILVSDLRKEKANQEIYLKSLFGWNKVYKTIDKYLLCDPVFTPTTKANFSFFNFSIENGYKKMDFEWDGGRKIIINGNVYSSEYFDYVDKDNLLYFKDSDSPLIFCEKKKSITYLRTLIFLNEPIFLSKGEKICIRK